MGDRGKQPNTQPLAKILSKVDLGFAIYGLLVTSVGMIILSQSPKTIQDYVDKNPEQEDFVNFLKFNEQKQWMIIYIYFGWYVLELFLAVIFMLGANSKNYCLLKLWLIVTVLNCLAGLGSAVPAYLFTAYKTVFVLFALIVYCYKLYCIYVVDLFVREICKAMDRR